MMTYASADLAELADRVQVAHADHRYAAIARRAFAKVDALRAELADSERKVLEARLAEASESKEGQ